MSTHNPEAKTRTGQKVLQYLKDHPDEMSPTRIARVTGCDRETARHYLRKHQASRGNPAPAEVAESSAPPPVKVAEPTAESATPAKAGRRFDEDFPRPKPKPAPVPPPPVERTAEGVPDDPGADSDDEDHGGPLGWLL